MDSGLSQKALSIKFPALSFCQGSLCVAASSNDISVGTNLALKKRFEDFVIVDSSGNKFRVVDVRKIRPLPLRFRFGDFLEFLSGNRRWQIEFRYADDSPSGISLPDVKDLIFDCFDKNPDFWDEMTHFEEFRDMIAKADSWDRLFSAFKRYHLL